MSKPEFIRLPKTGERCPYTGLSRTELNGLILPNAKNGGRSSVASVSLRKRGALRGTRLINYDSLIAHLHSISAKPDGIKDADLLRRWEKLSYPANDSAA